jgi:hypothetical protein
MLCRLELTSPNMRCSEPLRASRHLLPPCHLSTYHAATAPLSAVAELVSLGA